MSIINLGLPATKIRMATPEEQAQEVAHERFQEVKLGDIEKRIQQAMPQLKIRADFASALERHRAGPEDIALCIGEVLNEGETHQIRLRAAEIAMKSMGLFENQQLSQGNVTFQIHGENVNLQAVLQPNREKEELVSQ